MINSRDIKDLSPKAQTKCKEFLKGCLALGLSVLVIQTLRDATYQNSLYQQGRTKAGGIVTNCDGYKIKSAHQSGNAWDAVPLDSHGKANWNDAVAFKKMALLGKSLGLRCGYYFKSVDSPHFELI